jgi:hypothetical protein
MKLAWYSLIFCLGLGIISPAARSELVLDTQQVTLSTNHGQALHKSLRLTSTEAIKQPLQITPSDLELANGSARIPAQAIAVTTLNTPLSANQTKTLEIQIKGDALNKSGEFTGNLLIQYDGNSKTLPLTIRVKSHAGLPWLVLLAGAGLGTGLSLYRTVGLPKDELLVRVGKLRTQLRGETEPSAERFKAQVEGELIGVETALSNRDWQTAETHLQTAQTIWTRWLSGKPDWIAQIAYLDALLKEVNDSNAYQQAMKAQLETIQRQLAECETPQVLANQVRPVRESLAQYQRGEVWLTQLSDLSAELKDSAQADLWDQKRARLQDELGSLAPGQTDGFNAWLDKIKAAEEDLSQAVAKQATRSLTSSDRSGTAFSTGMSHLRPMPAVSQQGRREPTQNAQQSLNRFQVVSQTAAIALIAWLGMAEIYEKDATFGGKPISDYLGLFAWGFGAEVSRDAIVKALGDLKAPLGLKKKENS